jgi:hypothetical protein
MFSATRMRILIASLPLLLGAGGAPTPGESFVRALVRSLGGIETTCFRKIQQLEEKMREKEPQMEFRTSCAKLSPESSSLERVQRAVAKLTDRTQPHGVSTVLLDDWIRHETFGISYSVKCRVADESVDEHVIVWWHPATRLLEFRTWNASQDGSTPPDAAPPG